MEVRVLIKSQLSSLIDRIIEHVPVVGVKQKEGKYVYAKLDQGKEFCPDFDVTVQSPKEFIFPPRETLFDFTLGKDMQLNPHYSKDTLVIWGVHPYDIKAINILDAIFRDTHQDKHYLMRRENTFIVGIDPLRASEKSFWSSMEADKVDKGFDFILTDLGDEYIITIGTQKGRDMLDKHGVSNLASETQIKARDRVREKQKDLCLSNRKLNFPLKMLPYLLMKGEINKLWKEKAEKCFSCGSCNLVCPTCYCFDVQDEVDITLTRGERYRVWDGCLLENFALVATGENFRGEKYQRYRHRFYRKGLYLKKKYGQFACVGCGRCATACLPDIADPVDIFNTLFNSLKGVLIHG